MKDKGWFADIVINSQYAFEVIFRIYSLFLLSICNYHQL